MANKASPSPSRLPVLVKNTTPTNCAASVHTERAGSDKSSTAGFQTSFLYGQNGSVKAEFDSAKIQKNGETHHMSKDEVMHEAPSTKYKLNHTGAGEKYDILETNIKEGIECNFKPSNTSSKIARLIKDPIPPSSIAFEQGKTPMAAATSNQVTDFPFVQAPVAEIEELSDLSQSSCSESDFGNGPTNSASRLPSSNVDANGPIDTYESNTDPPTTSESMCGEITSSDKPKGQVPESNSSGVCDTWFSEPPSSGDSGFVHDGHVSDPELAEKGSPDVTEHVLSREGGYTSDETLTERKGILDNSLSNSDSAGDCLNHTMVTSRSGEKFGVSGVNLQKPSKSKSHENYLQAGASIAVVNIDIEDNLANSLDALTYHDSPYSSVDNVTSLSEPPQVSRSLENSPEKKSEKCNGDYLPPFRTWEDTKTGKLKLGSGANSAPDALQETNNSGNSCFSMNDSSISYSWNKTDGELELSVDDTIQVLETPSGDSLNMSVLSDESDSDSLYHQPSKAVDRPSAVRLAKRLFHLEGFRKSDVSRHLSKKNDFSNLVAEEYLKFFDFQGDTLDSALRKFLQHFSLYGETQERERVLAHFSHRYMESNPGSFNSEDACHTLTCAIMLLNTDLHAPNVSRRMTSQEFIENLAELNDGENFQTEILKAIYQAIKSEPMEWAVDQSASEGGISPSEQTQLSQTPQVIGSNPFLDVPDPSKTTEYKRGYVMRKCCMEPDKRKTPFGKRSWKMLYAVLRDMIMYQYKDEHQLKKGQFVENSHNAIRIHHALATKAADYTKKQHVFRLQTADWAEYLFQTGDSKELQEWVDSINLVAASLSAPPLPGAVGSRTKFQRQLLPSTYTRLNLREQLQSHKTKVHELEQELLNHQSEAPEKGAKSSVCQDYIDKETYLEFEIQRFKIYVYLLNSKLSLYPEAGEGSLVETSIGELEEFTHPGNTGGPLSVAPATVDLTQIAVSVPPAQLQPVAHQQSLTDSLEDEAYDCAIEKHEPLVNLVMEVTHL